MLMSVRANGTLGCFPFQGVTENSGLTPDLLLKLVALVQGADGVAAETLMQALWSTRLEAPGGRYGLLCSRAERSPLPL